MVFLFFYLSLEILYLFVWIWSKLQLLIIYHGLKYNMSDFLIDIGVLLLEKSPGSADGTWK